VEIIKKSPVKDYLFKIDSSAIEKTNQKKIKRNHKKEKKNSYKNG